MSPILKLRVTLQYGTYPGAHGGPSAADHAELEKMCASVAADMGDDALFARTESTDTTSWPTKTLMLSYSAFHHAADALHALAKVWQSKLEAAYGVTVIVDAYTD